MPGLRKLGLTTALLVGLCLAAITAAATARRFTVSEIRFTASWAGVEKLDFGSPEGFSVACPVYVVGEFHSRTFAKVSGLLIGAISFAIKPAGEPCVRREGERWGEMWILNGIEEMERRILPETLTWHIRYDSFTGSLPRITSVRIQIVDASFLVQGTFGLLCLYKSTDARPLFARFELTANGTIEKVRVDETQPIPLHEGAFCPSTGTVKRKGLVRTPDEATITIGLVA
jgi:hypothetical protein